MYKFTPIEKPFITVVNWELSLDDYTKLKAGNEQAKSPWKCIMDQDIFHISKGYEDGIEHYRFAVHKGAYNTFTVRSIESLRPLIEADTYAEFLDDISWKKNDTKIVASNSTAEEVKIILRYLFNINFITSRSSGNRVMQREEYQKVLLDKGFVFVKTQMGFPGRGAEDVYTHPSYTYKFYVTRLRVDNESLYGFYMGQRNGKYFDSIVARNEVENFRKNKHLQLWTDGAFLKLMDNFKS